MSFIGIRHSVSPSSLTLLVLLFFIVIKNIVRGCCAVSSVWTVNQLITYALVWKSQQSLSDMAFSKELLRHSFQHIFFYKYEHFNLVWATSL